jgi:formylglycine-generating enzyme required for sulfatase activity
LRWGCARGNVIPVLPSLGAIVMVRITARLLPVLFLLFAAAQGVHAEKRVALVIGNGKYIHAGTLANPVNDASDMAAALKGAGFTVISGYDLDKQGLEKKIREFAGALAAGDTGVFFYAGHGLQVAGTNYIVPVDAELSTADALEFEMIKLESVQRIMENAAKTNIFFLDACRNNPLARNLARALGTRGSTIGRGLAPAESGVGTLISFSTQPGNVAQDGTGRNSPFTGPLVKRIAAPGEDILTVLTAVRNEVLAATQEQQVPWENHALRAKFYFNPAPAAPAASPQAQAPLGEAAQAWAEIKNAKDIAVFEAFRKQYGPANALYDTLAAQKIAELTSSQVAVAVAPKSAPARPPAEACEDGLLVSVAMGPNPCIKPGSGESFKDCPECPEMVVVPPGSFTMGSPPGEPERSSGEGPQHEVRIAKPFAVGRFAVTFAEWYACAADGGCGGYRPGDQGWGRADRPVVNVSFEDAKAYVKWISQKTGRNYRLLSEAEREYVTRAGTKTPFCWGTSITPEQANYNGNYTYAGGGRKGESRQKTVSVKSFQPNPWGLYQVHGNVWEWVEDCWSDSYNGAPGDGSAWTTGYCKVRVLRGGSWSSVPWLLRVASRIGGIADIRYGYIGFRLARTLD